MLIRSPESIYHKIKAQLTENDYVGLAKETHCGLNINKDWYIIYFLDPIIVKEYTGEEPKFCSICERIENETLLQR